MSIFDKIKDFFSDCPPSEPKIDPWFRQSGHDTHDDPESIVPVTHEVDGDDAPDEIVGSVINVEYISAAGETTRRRVSVSTIQHNAKGELCLVCYCFLRHATRTLRMDRITAIFDADGVMEEPAGFFARYNIVISVTNTPIPKKATPPGYAQRKVARNGIRVLCALARIDGHMHSAEIEKIAGYAASVAEDHNIATTEKDRTALIKYLHRQYPGPAVISRCLDGLRKEPDHLQKLFLHYATDVMDADGIQHEKEAAMTIDLHNALKDADVSSPPDQFVGGDPPSNQAPHDNKAMFRELARSADWMVIDVETTGVSKASEILEIAVVSAKGEVLLNTTILPKGHISKQVSNIHGLTRDFLKKSNSPAWPEIHDTVIEILKSKSLLVSYNADFEKRLLAQTAEKHGLSFPALPWRCAMKAYADYRKSSWFKLSAAAKDEGIDTGNMHRALDDCQTTLGLIRAIISKT